MVNCSMFVCLFFTAYHKLIDCSKGVTMSGLSFDIVKVIVGNDEHLVGNTKVDNMHFKLL